MEDTAKSARLIRFGVFEVDLAARELRKSGVRIKLQDQPFRVLALLLERPGEIVTREELREAIWSDDTFVEFDASLNTAIQKIRQALGDSAGNARFVETIPRQGYRFIAPVEGGPTKQEQPQSLNNAEVTSSEATNQPERANRFLRLTLGAMAVLLVAVAGISLSSWVRSSRIDPQPPLRRFTLPLGAGEGREIAISPDGRRIAYITLAGNRRELWIWDLERSSPHQVEAASGARYPSWSPAGDSVVFGIPGGQLKKVSVEGGSALTLCSYPASILGGSSWSPDGNSIVFSAGESFNQRRLYEVSAQGGTPKLLFEPAESEQMRGFFNPHFLPHEAGGRSLLFAVGVPNEAQIRVFNLESGEGNVLAAGRRPFYSRTGHIVYETAADLWALPFSIETLAATGEPFPIRENASYPSGSRDGALVYRSGRARLTQLTWRDRSGAQLGSIGQSQESIQMPVLSPDGSRVVVVASENETDDVWVHEVARGLKRRVTFDPAREDRPTWTSEGNKISFSSYESGNTDLFIKAADGSGEREELLATPTSEFGYEWSRDGKYLVGSGAGELWYLRAQEGQTGYEQVMFFETPFDELSPDLSHDTRFLAYESNESGRYEVYVQPFPDGGSKFQISKKGGGQPRWRGDGKEIFYIEDNTVLMAVSVTTSPTFSVGPAKRLFEDQRAFVGRGHQYDVTPDGQRFVVVEALEEAEAGRAIHVVLNWYEEFRDRETQP